MHAVRLKCHVVTLRSGRPCLVLPDAAAAVAAVQLWVPAGAASDPPGRGGVAHLLEHLMFKETRQLTDGEFDRRAEALGAEPNAITWLDWTCYHQLVPAEEFAAMLDLEAERFAHFRVTPASFAAEHSVVRNERAGQIDDDPEAVLEERLLALRFGKHVYGRPTIGAAAELAHLRPADVRAYYRRYYAAAVPVVAGGVTLAACRRALESAFGAIPYLAAPDRGAAAPSWPATPAIERVSTMAEDGRMLLLYPGVAAGDPSLAAIYVLSQFLCGGESGLLFRRLVLEAELASSIESDVVALRRGGQIEIAVYGPAGDALRVNAVRDIILAAVAEIANGGVVRDDYEAARQRMRLRLLRGLRAPDERAFQAGESFVTTGDPRRVERIWRDLSTLTVERFIAVARRVFAVAPLGVYTGKARA